MSRAEKSSRVLDAVAAELDDHVAAAEAGAGGGGVALDLGDQQAVVDVEAESLGPQRRERLDRHAQQRRACTIASGSGTAVALTRSGSPSAKAIDAFLVRLDAEQCGVGIDDVARRRPLIDDTVRAFGPSSRTVDDDGRGRRDLRALGELEVARPPSSPAPGSSARGSGRAAC